MNLLLNFFNHMKEDYNYFKRNLKWLFSKNKDSEYRFITFSCNKFKNKK